MKAILARSRAALDAVAARLIDKEVIDGPELLQLLTRSGFEPNETARRTLAEHFPHYLHGLANATVPGVAAQVEPAA